MAKVYLIVNQKFRQNSPKFADRLDLMRKYIVFAICIYIYIYIYILGIYVYVRRWDESQVHINSEICNAPIMICQTMSKI